MEAKQGVAALAERDPELDRMLDMTVTELYSIPDTEVEELRISRLRDHFEFMRERIPVLQHFAEEQGVDSIKTIEDGALLLFPHSVYKSYPLSALEKSRFDVLTQWLQTLTSHDLSSLNLDACDCIDAWLDELDRIGLKCKHSSGTTGKISVLPRNEDEARSGARSFGNLFQGFGEEPNAELPGFHDLPIILTSHRKGGLGMPRTIDGVVQHCRGGNEASVIAANPGRISADAISIGGRLRVAESKGELGMFQISPALMARRDAFIKEQEETPERMRAFFEHIRTTLSGKRVIMVTLLAHLYDIAEEALANGVSGVFAPDSFALVAGGAKGRVLPDDYQETVKKFLGIDHFPTQSYGMSEMVAGGSRACPNGNYHIRPYVIPYLLDPDTGKQFPRTGTHTGRYGFIDLVAESHWGGFLTGDEVTITWDKPCGCGRNGAYIHPQVRRYSEMEGGDDKITCAGAPDMQDRALQFIAQAAG